MSSTDNKGNKFKLASYPLIGTCIISIVLSLILNSENHIYKNDLNKRMLQLGNTQWLNAAADAFLVFFPLT